MDGAPASEPATVVGGDLLGTLCTQLEKAMSFGRGERDLFMFQHKFVIEWKSEKRYITAEHHCSPSTGPGQQETLNSTLELLGDLNGYSAMAMSVGGTCSIATQLLIDGHPAIPKPAVHARFTKDKYSAIGIELEKWGVQMLERQILSGAKLTWPVEELETRRL